MEGDTGDKGERGGPGECKKGEPPVSAIVLMVDGEGATKGAGDRWTTECGENEISTMRRRVLKIMRTDSNDFY
jgi:hypothetical protein